MIPDNDLAPSLSALDNRKLTELVGELAERAGLTPDEASYLAFNLRSRMAPEPEAPAESWQSVLARTLFSNVKTKGGAA